MNYLKPKSESEIVIGCMAKYRLVLCFDRSSVSYLGRSRPTSGISLRSPEKNTNTLVFVPEFTKPLLQTYNCKTRHVVNFQTCLWPGILTLPLFSVSIMNQRPRDSDQDLKKKRASIGDLLESGHAVRRCIQDGPEYQLWNVIVEHPNKSANLR